MSQTTFEYHREQKEIEIVKKQSYRVLTLPTVPKCTITQVSTHYLRKQMVVSYYGLK
jgi:hypothetical protein